MGTFDYVLYVTDSSSTVTLTTSPFQVRAYQPTTAPADQPSVSETIEYRLIDGSPAANLDEFRTLARLLKQAEDAQDNRTLNKVYLNWKESASGTVWRAELVQARPEWEAEALDRAHWTGDTQFSNIFLERRNFWEGPESQVLISNSGGTSQSSGVTVTNNPASTNYLDIAGTSVIGDLPGATRLEITNNTSEGAGTGLFHVWIGQNYTNPTSFDGLVQAEDMTNFTDVANADASGGNYGTVLVNSTGSESKISEGTVSGTVLTNAAGRFYKAMFRFFQDPRVSIRWRLKLSWNNATVWEGPLVSIDTGYVVTLRDMATMRLPPWLPGLSSLAPLVLQIYAIGGGTGAVNLFRLDYIYFLPVDGFRYLRALGYNLPQNSRVIDDGIDSRLYADNGTTEKIGLFVGYGQQIMLEPAKAQRLYFMLAGNNGVVGSSADDSSITRTASVKVFYRPRRISL
jgi:hypothetical protein